MDTKDIKIGTKFAHHTGTYKITKFYRRKLLEENSELLFDCISEKDGELYRYSLFSNLIDGTYKIIK